MEAAQHKTLKCKKSGNSETQSEGWRQSVLNYLNISVQPVWSCFMEPEVTVFGLRDEVQIYQHICLASCVHKLYRCNPETHISDDQCDKVSYTNPLLKFSSQNSKNKLLVQSAPSGIAWYFSVNVVKWHKQSQDSNQMRGCLAER